MSRFNIGMRLSYHDMYIGTVQLRKGELWLINNYPHPIKIKRWIKERKFQKSDSFFCMVDCPIRDQDLKQISEEEYQDYTKALRKFNIRPI